MLNSNSTEALKRIAATLLGMGKTRLELAGVELAQARQTAVRTIVWSLSAALALAFASLFLCFLVITLFWETHRVPAIAGCAVFYLALAVWFQARLKSTLADQPSLFEATISELGRDRQAVLDSLTAEAPNTSSRGSNEQGI